MDEFILNRSGSAFTVLSFGIVLLVAIGYGAENRIVVVAGVIAINLLLLGLRTIFSRNRAIRAFHEGQIRVLKIVNFAVVRIGLYITYILGVGFVWLTSRIVGKKFLELKINESTWKKHEKNMRHTEPY